MSGYAFYYEVTPSADADGVIRYNKPYTKEKWLRETFIVFVVLGFFTGLLASHAFKTVAITLWDLL